MKLDDVDFQYFIDYLEKRVHVLDYDPRGAKLMNTISPQFIKRFIEKEKLMLDVADFEWICYNDKLVMKFQNYNMYMLSKKMPYLHKPFLKIMETRSKDSWSD